MTSILDQVDWGNPTLSLLQKTNTLDTNAPALIHIRHSERDLGKLHTDLTQTGLEASRQFGTQLPKNRKYRLYHTPYSRTENTAKKIIEGIQENQGQATIKDTIELSTLRDEEKGYANIRKHWDEKTKIRAWFYKWAAGHYPPWIMSSTLDAAQHLAGIMMQNLDTASSDSIDIYVTHDTYVAVCIFHWFGLMIDRWVSFLDGYLVQFYPEFMKVFFSDTTIESEYPHWWTF
jgi:broad specificity phosphatase PhoE